MEQRRLSAYRRAVTFADHIGGNASAQVSIIHTDDASALVARQKEIIEEMRAVKAENDIGLLVLCVVNGQINGPRRGLLTN